MRILFVSANPDWTPRLDLLDELRELKQSLKGKKYLLELLPAAQPEDLKDAIDSNDDAIDILHFTGHGTKQDGLLFRKSDGRKTAITASDLNEMFRNKKVKLAVLNACHTQATAEGITGFANTVIGTTAKLEEISAKKLTKVLYAALGNGKSIDEAFKEATQTLDKTGLQNIYKPYRLAEKTPADLQFDSGDLEVDQENEDNWDRYFFQSYLEEQIGDLTKNVKLNQRILTILVGFGVAILFVSWGEHIYHSNPGDFKGVLYQIVIDVFGTITGFGRMMLGMAQESVSERPLLDWLTNVGEAIPLFVASMQHRWCVHGNDKIRQLTALKELVENSEELSDTLRTRLHKVLDQSVRAANPNWSGEQESAEAAEPHAG
jgi:hypothetical protein